MDADEVRRRLTLAAIWAAVAVGLTALALHLMLPRFHDVADHCDMQATADAAFAGDWLVVRGPATPTSPPTYDPGNDTSFVAPGCGDRSAPFVLRVRGDHRGFDGPEDRLVLAGDAGAERVYGQVADGKVLVPGTYTPHSPWWSVTILAVLPAAFLVALGLKLRPRSTLWAALALPSVLGTLLAHVAVTTPEWRLLLGLTAPFAMLPAWAIQPRPKFWGIVLLSLAAIAIYAAVVVGTLWATQALYPDLA